MTPADLLTDALGRVREDVDGVLDNLDDATLHASPGNGANTIGWLIWHLSRVQDDHIAGVAGTEQVYTAEGFAERFALDLDVADHGYGHTPEQAAAVSGFGADLLAEYHRATYARSAEYLAGVSADDLERVVDTNWDPPVTLGVRLVSVCNDCAQHVGQAAYLRGLFGSWAPPSG
ncbi:mycothiol transferase [Nocardioides sambongensis]|uniref:mycothiol transferase n=1 Tax=Nocardioides sambongensis TaxID=2589074 RepID=UPI00112C8CD7|nr:DUF664 domain-containing protein [Nocardioides sambongensis]